MQSHKGGPKGNSLIRYTERGTNRSPWRQDKALRLYFTLYAFNTKHNFNNIIDHFLPLTCHNQECLLSLVTHNPPNGTTQQLREHREVTAQWLEAGASISDDMNTCGVCDLVEVLFNVPTAHRMHLIYKPGGKSSRHTAVMKQPTIAYIMHATL